MATAPDPFGTAAIRAAVLDTWAASPTRFREDANGEEYLSRGYAGRVVAELVANGADAAKQAGEPGEILICLVPGELRVANTGAPLSADGVRALASLRASAKRAARPDDGRGDGEPTTTDSVGHFGVGFTSVRAVTAEPVVVSTTGAVRFSAAATADAIRRLAVPDLLGELEQRHGQLPALRLPWPAPGLAPPPGFATEVRLPLRDPGDEVLLAEQLSPQSAIDLLWALPSLIAVTVPGYRVERAPESSGQDVVEIRITPRGDAISGVPVTANEEQVGEQPATAAAEDAVIRRFRVASGAGTLPAELLADLPVEERRREEWRVTWVVEIDDDFAPVPIPHAFVGAPTPTAERIAMPATLVATLPVDEDRSRIAAGAVTGYVVEQAARTYAQLVRAAPMNLRTALVPAALFPLGAFDATLREEVSAQLGSTDFLVDAAGNPTSPAEAVVVAGLTGAAAAGAAEALPGLLDWPGASVVDRLRPLGLREIALHEAMAALAQLDREPSFWRSVYDALADLPAEGLADLPVPKAGGGTIVGARDVLLPEANGNWLSAASRLIPRLRLAAAGVDHPLLRRLGARPADAAALLETPELVREIRRRREDFEGGIDSGGDFDGDMCDNTSGGSGGDPSGDLHPAESAGDPFARLVLTLVAQAQSSAGEAVGAGELILTGDDGAPYPAGELLLPGAPLAEILADDIDLPTIADSWLEAFGTDVLAAVGVRRGLAVGRFAQPPDDDADLDDVDAWWEQSSSEPGETFTAILDLDLIADGAWPQAIAMIATSRPTREALRRTALGPSYSAWWLRRHATIDGVPLRRWRLADAADLAGLYDVFPLNVAGDIAADLGVLTRLADAAGEPAELLARWADPGRDLPAWRVSAVTAAVVEALASQAVQGAADDLDRGPADDDIRLPATVRAMSGAVLDGDRAVVLDEPALAQIIDVGRAVAGSADPGLVADILDLPLASAEIRAEVVAMGSPVVTALSGRQDTSRCLDLLGRWDLAPHTVVVDPNLAVWVTGGADLCSASAGDSRRVAWWSDETGLYMDGTPAGTARAVAHLADRWKERHALTAAASNDPVSLAEHGIA